jgi:hypothetical protein
MGLLERPRGVAADARGLSAVDDKIAEQHKFVAWWNNEVTRGKGWEGKKLKTENAVLSLREAEELTGMKQQRSPISGSVRMSTNFGKRHHRTA